MGTKAKTTSRLCAAIIFFAAAISCVSCHNRTNRANDLTGTWEFITTYSNVQGQWTEYPTDAPDSAAFTFRPDGTMSDVYCVDGKQTVKERSYKYDPKTRELWFDGKFAATVEIPDEQTLELHYTDGYNSSTGERVQGDFKDTYKKQK